MKKIILILIAMFTWAIQIYSQWQYDNYVAPFWTATSTDEAKSVKVKGGNVYVTGNCYDGATYAVMTIKYDANLNELWRAIYTPPNGPQYQVAVNGFDIDNNGYVYIAGYISNGTNDDYLTIKYDANGVNTNPIWTQIYDGGVGDDQATSIALDNQGNIYVTGYSMQNHTYPGNPNYDMATIAYHPDGTKIWTNLLNGVSLFDLPPAYYEAQGDDYAFDIATYTGDVSGTSPAVFICGKSWLSSTYGNAYITVQLNLSNGRTYWWSLYKLDQYTGTEDASALAIAVSQQTSAVYTCGYKSKKTSSNRDCVTMQNHWGLRSTCGHECEDWCASYADEEGSPGCNIGGLPDFGYDEGKAISIIDASQENRIQIFVTGYTHTAYDQIDYLVLKYFGTTITVPPCDPEHYPPNTVNTFNAGGNDFAKSITINSSGSKIFVTGNSDAYSGPHIVTIQYNTSLAYAGYAEFFDEGGSGANSIAVDGNFVYVAGYINMVQGLNKNFLVLKYIAYGGGDIKVSNPGTQKLNGIPENYGLSQNFPNPFNPSTTINYSIPRASNVSMKIYNTLGQIVMNIPSKYREPGYYSEDINASSWASGIYFYKIEARDVSNTANTFIDTKKMLVIK